MRLFVFGRKASFRAVVSMLPVVAAARFNARPQSRKVNRHQWARLNSSEFT